MEPLQGSAGAEIDGAAETDGPGGVEPDQGDRDRRPPTQPPRSTAADDASRSPTHQSEHRAGQGAALSDGAALTDGAAASGNAGGIDSTRRERDQRTETQPPRLVAVLDASLDAPHQSAQRAGQRGVETGAAAQTDGAPTKAGAGSIVRPATLMERLAHRSVLRLRALISRAPQACAHVGFLL